MFSVILALALLSRPPAPAAGESRLPVAVRPTDLDVKGHANNARHVEYLQWGRWRWLEDRGLSDASLRAEGCVLVVARIEVDYRAEVTYPGTLTVATSVVETDEKKVVFRQEIRRDDGTLAAEAKVIMVAIDPATRRSRPLPDSLRSALLALALGPLAIPEPRPWAPARDYMPARQAKTIAEYRSGLGWTTDDRRWHTRPWRKTRTWRGGVGEEYCDDPTCLGCCRDVYGDEFAEHPALRHKAGLDW